MKTVLSFTLGALFLGGAALAISFFSWDEDVTIQAAIAFGLTFVPAVMALAFVMLSFRGAPENRLLAGLAGSGMRMAIALGGGALLANGAPALIGIAFWSWLIFFYLALLGFEMTLVVMQPPTLDAPPKG